MPDIEPTHSRGSSSARQDGYTSDSSRISQKTKPINEAINSAVNTTHAADSGIPPELLERLTSQITANIIKELKTSNLQPASSNASHVTDNGSSTGGSPPLGRASVYTPPSPNRQAEEYPQPSPNRQTDEFPQPSPRKSERVSPPPDRYASPLNQYEHADDSDAREGRSTRPKAPQRISTMGDMTVLEKIWGKLFTENGEATPRLGQFLKGVAVYLIEAYEPTYSLVITPPKLQQFYQDTKVTNEIYPWQVVFDDRTSSISRMLREVEAQHHLVQEKLNGRPDIPGLTPQGFETWATLLIKAHPEQEFERLAKVAMDMPIDNPDDRKERFPKELTRRLFPKQADNTVAARLQKAMSVHCNVTFKTRTDSTAGADRDDNATPQAVPRSTQETFDRTEPTIAPVTSHSSSNSAAKYQRDTKPQSFSSDTDALFDSEEENAPTPQPIERQRQPYVAQPGGGKHYDSVDINNASAEVRPAASTSDFRPPPQDTKPGRSMSMRSNGVERPRPAPISIHQPAGTAPIEVPESRNHRTSTYRREGPVGSAPRRTRSPSMSKENAAGSSRVDANDLYGHHSQSAGPNTDTFPGLGNERDRRYRDYESRRERFPEDRYDAARMSAYDPRERDRDRERVDKGSIPERADMRQRGQSIALGLGVDPGREEEYYRSSAYPPPSSAQPHSAGAGYERPRERERERDIPFRDPAYGAYQGGGVPQSAGGHYPPNAYRDAR